MSYRGTSVHHFDDDALEISILSCPSKYTPTDARRERIEGRPDQWIITRGRFNNPLTLSEYNDPLCVTSSTK